MEAIKAIEGRKSTRGYTGELIDPYDIDILVMAARCAPKAGEFFITVISNQDTLKEIDEKTLDEMKNSGNEFLMGRAALDGYRPLYGAPVMFMISAKEGPYSAITAGNSGTAITYAATALGLASCFIISPTLVVNKDQELMKKIGVPDGYKPICCVLVGHEATDKYSMPRTQVENVNYCK